MSGCCMSGFLSRWRLARQSDELRNSDSFNSFKQGRINHLVGPIRTPQRRGPTGKLDAEEGERGGEGCPLPKQLGVWGALYKLLGGVRGKARADKKAMLSQGNRAMPL